MQSAYITQPMNSAVMSASVSRPKVHRLPPPPSRFSKKRLAAWLLKGGTALFAIVAVGVLVSKVDVSVSPMNGPAAVSNAVAAPIPMEKQSDTIVLTDQSGTIVGQMAKIPTQHEQITEIKTLSQVDNRAGRDLLSIISKY